MAVIWSIPHPGESSRLVARSGGVSITEAAQAMAISRKTLSKIVNGRGRGPRRLRCVCLSPLAAAKAG